MISQLKSRVRASNKPEIIGATAQISFLLLIFLDRSEIPIVADRAIASHHKIGWKLET